MVYRVLLLALLLFPFAARAQRYSYDSAGITPSVRQLVRQMVADGSLVSSAVGAVGEETDQWRRFLRLTETADSAELVALTAHPDPVVRCYAFQGLKSQKRRGLLAVVEPHLHDTATVAWLNGCIKWGIRVGDYMLLELGRLSSPIDQRRLDSLLRFDPTLQLEAATAWLTTQPPDLRTYQRVRELAADNRNPNRARKAVVALAAYRQPEDRAFISRLLNSTDSDVQYYGLWAARRYPDPGFFPRIKAIHRAELRKKTGFDYAMLRQLYQVIAQYQNQPARQLLLATLALPQGSTRNYHLPYVWLALQKCQAPIYRDLRVNVNLPDYEKKELLRGDY